MSATPIHVLQLCVLSGAKRSILHHWQRWASGQPAIRVSAVFIRSPHDFFSTPVWDDTPQLELHELVQRARFDPSLLWRLGSLLGRLRPDIVHAHDATSHLLALVLQPVYGFRLVASACDWANDSWRKRLSIELAHKLLPGFHRVIAANPRVARRLCDLGCRPAQIDVVPESVDTEMFSPAAADGDLRGELQLARDTKVVGTHGALLDGASLRLLIRGLRSAQTRIGPIHLVVLDPGDVRGAAEALAREYGMLERLHALRLARRQPQAYATLDLFVAPGDVRELPQAILEAQSMELPVVAVRSEAIAQLVEDGTTAILLDDPTPEILGAQIARLLVDRREARSLGSAARLRICQQFRAADRQQRLARIYQRTLLQA